MSLVILFLLMFFASFPQCILPVLVLCAVGLLCLAGDDGIATRRELRR